MRGSGAPPISKRIFSDVEWSTRGEDRRRIAPTPPVVVRLKVDVARENGLLQDWFPAYSIPKLNDTISLAAPYDWDSPKWPAPGEYPDSAAYNSLQVALASLGQGRVEKGLGNGACTRLGSRHPVVGKPRIQLPSSRPRPEGYIDRSSSSR